MKIALLTTSDTTGGAAIAASRLASALADAGQEVTMVTRQGRSRLPFVAERLDIFARNGLSRSDLFKVSTARFGVDVASLPAVREADAVILGWVNQGFLSLDAIARIGKPIVWVMHDMWCLTGICHHSLGCTAFERECGDCPFIHGPWRGPNDLSHRTWERKRRLYASTPIHFVAVSRWLGSLARRSSLLRQLPVDVIPNPHQISAFTPGRDNGNVIAFCAARLDDPIKGLELATEAFNRLADEGVDARVELAGHIRDRKLPDKIRLPHTWLGPLGSEDMRALLTRASVVLNASHYENLPNVLIEGLASGAIPVAFDRGGQGDIITHLTNGYLAKYPDTDDLARGLRWALKAEISPRALHDDAAARFDAPAIASRIIEIMAAAPRATATN